MKLFNFVYLLSGPDCDSSCTLIPTDPKITEKVQKIVKEKAKLIRYRLEMDAENDKNLLLEDSNVTYRGDLWVRAHTRHGQTLLSLTFNYDILSLMMLSFGTDEIKVKVTDSPERCFEKLSETCRTKLIENSILHDFEVNSTDSSMRDEEYICHQTVRNDDGYAKFGWACCSQEGRCVEDLGSKWLLVLNILITVVMYIVILFGPFLIPKWLYAFKADKDMYVVKLGDDTLRKSVYISSDKKPSIEFKHKITTHDIEKFPKFRKNIQSLPRDEKVTLLMPEFKIAVHYKHLLGEHHVPVGVMNLIYRMFCQCQIRTVGPCIDCCNASLLGCCNRAFFIHWIHFWKAVALIFFIFAIPIPFYLRLLIYYGYEHDEITARKDVISKLGLSESYESNLVQYLTPTHPIFIACYVFYFVCCFVFCLAFANVIGTGRVQRVMKSSFRELNKISYLKVIGMIVRIFLFPLKKCGCFGILVGLLYWPIVMPIVLIVAIIYSLPLVYLTFTMLWNVFVTKPPGQGQGQVQNRANQETGGNVKSDMSEMKAIMGDVRTTSVDDESEDEDEDDRDFHCGQRFWKIIHHLLAAILCLVFLYTCMIMLAEVAELIVELIVFTLMGIIVNAGSTLKYISLLFLVALYSYDCYNGVYKTYLDLNRKIIADVNGRIPDVKEVTRLPSHLQQNVAFRIDCEDYDRTGLEADFSPERKLSYEISNLVLFIDKHDNPRIPLKLFEEMCTIEVAGSPGPVYKSLLRATWKFLWIILFLIFVFLVVAAFGNIYKISSTNQMLATLAGGFIPFMLRNFMSPGGAATAYKSSVSFQAKFDEVIVNFIQSWPIGDIEFTLQEEDHDTDSGQASDGAEKGEGHDDGEGHSEGQGHNEDQGAQPEQDDQDPNATELLEIEKIDTSKDNSKYEVDLFIQVMPRKRPTFGYLLTRNARKSYDMIAESPTRKQDPEANL